MAAALSPPVRGPHLRALHIYGGNLFGGAEQLLVNLARFSGLAPSLEQEFALCFRARLWRELEAEGVPIHDLGRVRISRPWQAAAARRRLTALARSRGIEVGICHAWWSYALFGPALRRIGIPVALWCHNTATGKGWLERWAAQHQPDQLIACGLGMAANLEKLFPRQPVQVLAPPIATTAPISEDRRRELRQQLGASADDTVILHASRLESWKGHALLLEALAQLRGAAGWQAWMACGPQRSGETKRLLGLQRRAGELGLSERIHWLGERNDVDALMGAADIYCQPNTAPEPYGLAFLEALAHGLPVVATDFGGPTEILTPACGVLTPPLPEPLAQVLGDLLRDEDRRRAMGEAARERARELSDPAQQLARFQAMLARIAPSRSKMPA